MGCIQLINSSCDHANESWNSMRGDVYIDQLSNCQLLETGIVSEVLFWHTERYNSSLKILACSTKSLLSNEQAAHNLCGGRWCIGVFASKVFLLSVERLCFSLSPCVLNGNDQWGRPDMGVESVRNVFEKVRVHSFFVILVLRVLRVTSVKAVVRGTIE